MLVNYFQNDVEIGKTWQEFEPYTKALSVNVIIMRENNGNFTCVCYFALFSSFNKKSFLSSPRTEIRDKIRHKIIFCCSQNGLEITISTERKISE